MCSETHTLTQELVWWQQSIFGIPDPVDSTNLAVFQTAWPFCYIFLQSHSPKYCIHHTHTASLLLPSPPTHIHPHTQTLKSAHWQNGKFGCSRRRPPKTACDRWQCSRIEPTRIVKMKVYFSNTIILTSGGQTFSLTVPKENSKSAVEMKSLWKGGDALCLGQPLNSWSEIRPGVKLQLSFVKN